jgi:hypothetical protein
MNALMTWWAVSLTLLNHEFGNEVLSRSELLQVVPIFVAVLVWLTRILFIGALTMAGEHLMTLGKKGPGIRAATPARAKSIVPAQQTVLSRRPEAMAPSGATYGTSSRSGRRSSAKAAAKSPGSATGEAPAGNPVPPALRKVEEKQAEIPAGNRRPAQKPNGRVRQRPPIPGTRGNGITARSRRGN